MEEKLYFKPASYGKGIKKKDKPEKTDRAEKDDKTHRARNLILFLTLIVIIVLIILWLLRGKTTTRGQYPENVRNESLSCTSTTIEYPRGGQMTSDKRELKINSIFYGEEKLSSVGLIYTLEFGSNEEAYSAEAFNSTRFELDLQQIGRSPASFHKKFSRMDNKLVLTLQTDANEIDDLTYDYFLIPKDNIPVTLQDYRAAYESQGFICTSSIDNN